jgi:hypothetical protein
MVEHNDAMHIESTTDTPWITVRDTEMVYYYYYEHFLFSLLR